MYIKKVGRRSVGRFERLVVDGDGGNALTLPFLPGASQQLRHCSAQGGRACRIQPAAHRPQAACRRTSATQRTRYSVRSPSALRGGLDIQDNPGRKSM